MTAPLVVTLLLEPDAQQHFDALRREHFPPDRNVLAAHVTLFHHLPEDELDAIDADLQDVGRAQAFAVAVTGLQLLGGGVAYRLHSEALAALHADLSARWSAWLTRQDRQRFTPHVTVQNKVAPAVARELLARLSDGFVPSVVRAEGIGLWRYLGGPWEPVARYPFGER